MILNLDFYKNEIKYNELSREEFLINNYIGNYKEDEYEKIIERDNSIESLYTLSDMRKNIINWYPFEKDCTILEIGANLGQITGELCKNASKVVSVEFSKLRGQAIAKRHNDKKNLEVIVGNLKDIKFEEKFDYITLIGILEYAPIIYQTENPYEDLLKFLSTLLKDNGKMLIATNNKFGMRNWAVIDSNDRNLEYDAIISKMDSKKSQYLSKKMIDKLIQKVNLGQAKYYYPLPDYEYANVIFTDKFLPNKNNIHRNMTFFKDSYIVNFHENNAYLQIIEEDENLFKFFANSYFIEVGKNFKENNVKYVSFWNNRKPEYKLKTIMEEDKVYKYPENELAKSHIEKIKNNIDVLNKASIKVLDQYDEEKIISNIITEAKPYDEYVLEEGNKNGIDGIIKAINNFKEKILDKLEITNNVNNVFDNYGIFYKKEEIKYLTFVKNCLWDLNFQNCFIKDNELFIYDQEWEDDKIPLEFIIYRGIEIFTQLRNIINTNELYEKLGLQKYKSLFDRLEEKIDGKIYDNSIRLANHRPIKNVRGFIVENSDLKTKNIFLSSELQKLEKVNNITEEEISKMRKQIENQQNTINEIENSKGWKLTLKIRKVVSCFKRKEEK